MALRMCHLRRTLLTFPKTLFPQFQQLHENRISMCNKLLVTQTTITRNYTLEMRKSACQEHILRLLRNEIQYEFDRGPPKQLVATFNSFTINDHPGEQWISLKRKIAKNEEIKVEATMFDRAKYGDVTKDNVQPHITLIVSISKGDGDTLEIMCSAWPDSIEITKLYTRKTDKISAQAYVGPEFNDLDDELQDSLYDFLEARGINDDMAAFLHEYMKSKVRTEYVRWIGTLKSYMEK